MYSVFWMLLSTLSFTLMAFIIKLQTKNFSIADILFVRSAASVGFVLLLHLYLHFPLRTRVLGIHARRSVYGLVSMSTWYYTLGVLPMGVSVTLNYLSPLFLGHILYFFNASTSRPTLAELALIVLGLAGVIALLNPFGGGLRTDDAIPVCSGWALP